MSHFLASSEAQDAFWNISSHGGATVISPLKQKTDNLNAKTFRLLFTAQMRDSIVCNI